MKISKFKCDGINVTTRKTIDSKFFSRTLNMTYPDISAHTIVTGHGKISLVYASQYTQGESNFVQNHQAVQVLEEWYDFLTDRFRPSSGFHADPVDDLLEDHDESLGAVCTGGDNYNCCSDANPCREGAGDCDYNSNCAGDLLCGMDNCDPKIKTFSKTDDCCYWSGKIPT